MGVDVVIAQANQPNIEGVPWWASLILVPIVGAVVEVIRRERKTRASEPAPPLPPDPKPLPVPPGAGASADEKMGYAQQLIDEITASRDRFERELEESEAANRRLRARVDEQDSMIQQLQWIIGQMRGTGPTWTPPPPRTG